MKRTHITNKKIKALLVTGISFAALTFGYANTANIVKADTTTTETTSYSDKSTVVAHYQDENGNKLAEDQVIDGHIGVGYGTMRKAIDGFTLKDWQGPTEGYFENQPVEEVTYIYTKSNAETNNEQTPVANNGEQTGTNNNQNETPAGDNQNAKKPSDDKQNNTNATGKKDKQTQVAANATQPGKSNVEDPNSKAQLPQTGSAKNASISMILAGAAALLISFLGMFGIQRKQN